MDDKYKSFGSEVDCPLCGDTLRSICDQMGYREQFRCSKCEQLFERDRDPIVEINEGVVTESTSQEEDFKEYFCPEHEMMHVISEPIGALRVVSSEVSSYDTRHLECECGEYHSVYKLQIGTCFECDCSRVFELTVHKKNSD